MRIPRPSLTVQILLALAAGAALGMLRPQLGRSLEILGVAFVRLVLAVVAPLIFSGLATGIAAQENLRRLGALAVRALLCFAGLTAVALAAGMGLGLVLRPGAGFPALARPAGEVLASRGEPFLVRIFPHSIFDALARNDVLQIAIFAVVFGLAVNLAGEHGRPLREWCEALMQVMYKFTALVMRAAPIGVFGAAAAVAGREGGGLGAGLLRLILAVYLGLAFLLLLLFPLLALATRVPLRRFRNALGEPFAIAFATASVAAALPKAMENMERMGVPRAAVSFVLPVGLSLNPAGTTLFAGIAALFVLQASGFEARGAGFWSLYAALYLAGKGVAGVPRFGLVVTAAALTSIGMPEEAVAAGMGVLLGIDPLLDMPRTAVNITGNCLVAAMVSRRELLRGAAPARADAT